MIRNGRAPLAQRLPAPRAGILYVTLLLLAAALASVAIWGRNIGMAEDWHMVPAMTGNEENLAGWIWSQNNEHRLPLQRVFYLGLLWLTGDFRAGMVFSQLLLAALGITLARAAARARGCACWRDALFPLALLHLGHWENLVWGWQIQFVWSVVLTGLILALVVRKPDPGLGAGLAAIVVLALLPLSGANGIVMAAAMSPWLAAHGFARLGGARIGPWRFAPAAKHGSLWVGCIFVAGAVLPFLMIGVYFIGYERPPWSPPLATPYAFLRAAKDYFALALGPGTLRFSARLAALVLVSFIGLGAFFALRAAIGGRPEERLRASGLVLFIGAGLALGLVIALARGSYDYRMPDRYALFAVLPLLGAALAWEFYAPKRLGRTMVAALALSLIMLLPANTIGGFIWRNWYVDGMRSVEADIAAGIPIPELAERHYAFLLHWNKDHLRERMYMLHAAGIGPFADAELCAPPCDAPLSPIDVESAPGG